MNILLPVYKKSGQTPLQCIDNLRKHYPDYAGEKISVAGRLDPMSEGLLLLLIGEENKKRKDYEALEKVYEFSVIFGISTDSYDGLGIVENIFKPLTIAKLKKQLTDIIPSYLGKRHQSYPPFSSKPMNGKPLYYWARKQKINSYILPTKEISIYSLQLKSVEEIAFNKLADNIIKRIEIIQGEFRQKEIIKQWEDLKKQYKNTLFPTATFSLTCSSSTYVRSIAHDLGEKLTSGAVVYTIKRTRIGTFSLEDSKNLISQ